MDHKMSGYEKEISMLKRQLKDSNAALETTREKLAEAQDNILDLRYCGKVIVLSQVSLVVHLITALLLPSSQKIQKSFFDARPFMYACFVRLLKVLGLLTVNI